MGSQNPPSSEDRRRMLAEGSGNLGQAGQQYLAAGRWAEAQECLEAAGDGGGLASLADQALEQGDFFTWRQALKALDREPAEHDLAKLAKLAEKAQAAGKLAHAAAARSLLKPRG